MRMRETLFSLIVVGGISSMLPPPHALAATPTSTTTVVQSQAPLAPAKTKRWSASFSADHLMPTNDNFDPRTDFMFSGSFKFNSQNSAQLQQTFSKLYIKDRTQQEWPVDDTILYYIRTLESKPYDSTLKWRLGATLPISETSTRNALITNQSLAFIMEKRFFDNNLTLRLTPSARKFWNKYTTTIDGRPLKAAAAAIGFTAIYSVTDSLSLTGAANATNTWIEKTQYTQGEQSQDASYNFSLSASYDLSNSVSFSLGYSQADSTMREGRYAVYAYDPQITEMTLGLSYSF